MTGGNVEERLSRYAPRTRARAVARGSSKGALYCRSARGPRSASLAPARARASVRRRARQPDPAPLRSAGRRRPGQAPLTPLARIWIALGVARGLLALHTVNRVRFAPVAPRPEATTLCMTHPARWFSRFEVASSRGAGAPGRQVQQRTARRAADAQGARGTRPARVAPGSATHAFAAGSSVGVARTTDALPARSCRTWASRARWGPSRQRTRATSRVRAAALMLKHQCSGTHVARGTPLAADSFLAGRRGRPS